MYCLVCLHNRARDFFCPYCEPKIRVLFRSGQLSISKETKEDFESLPIHMQRKIIHLSNKRLGKILKNEIGNGYLETLRPSILMQEFRLEYLISEYIQMALRSYKDLDIPVRTEYDDILRQCYHQYITQRGGIL